MLPPDAAEAVLDADLDETFFFELAGLATTFFVETDLVFFDSDFWTAVFLVEALAFFFEEVFFEVPFFADVLGVLPVLFDRSPAFLALGADRLAGAFGAAFPAVLLPVFFFFLVAAFLLGIHSPPRATTRNRRLYICRTGAEAR